ncbi:MAG: GntR family transcriptional regulator [Planctomycetes bacterium]|nr:GntR family transcriptional regulator [Planctomycetota bacterium]
MSGATGVDAVLEQLRRQILERHLAVGERLPSERDLAMRLDCGRVMVRHAVRRLEQEGVIRHLGGYRRIIARMPNGAAMAPSLPPLDRGTALIAASSLTVTESRAAPGWSDFITLGAVQRLKAAGRQVRSVDVAHLDEGSLAAIAASPPGMLLVPESQPGQYHPGSDDWLRRLCGRLCAAGTAIAIFSGQHLLEEADHVLSDHAAGWEALTRHLVGLGYRRILPVLPEAAKSWTCERLAGYTRACASLGIAPLPEVRLHGDGVLMRGRARQHAVARIRLVAGNLIGRCQGIDAILAPSDAWVAACREAAVLHGAPVPVAGYDDFWSEHWDMAHFPGAPLATVDKCNVEIGARMADLALERQAAPTAPWRTIFVEPRVVVPA